MSKVKLSKSEQKLLNELEAGEYASVLAASRKAELEAAARHTFKAYL